MKKNSSYRVKNVKVHELGSINFHGLGASNQNSAWATFCYYLETVKLNRKRIKDSYTLCHGKAWVQSTKHNALMAINAGSWVVRGAVIQKVGWMLAALRQERKKSVFQSLTGDSEMLRGAI